MKTKVAAACSLLLVAAIELCVISAGAVPSSTGSALSGIVKFEGAAPKPTHIDMSADPNCVKAHPSPGTSEEIVTGPNGALANVVIYVADGLSGTNFQPAAEPAKIEQKGCTYKPHVLAMQANQKLEVTNSDSTTHNIHPMPANNREWNKTQPPGVPIEETFAREEIAIPVKCNVHPWMKGYIAVVKSPYFAVSDKDGSFAIQDLPAGAYTIKAWHEKLGTQTQKITVTAGQPTTVDFTFKQ